MKACIYFLYLKIHLYQTESEKQLIDYVKIILKSFKKGDNFCNRKLI